MYFQPLLNGLAMALGSFRVVGSRSYGSRHDSSGRWRGGPRSYPRGRYRVTVWAAL